MKRRRSEIERRTLREPDRVLRSRPRIANARPVGEVLLHQPKRGIKIELEGLRGQLRDQRIWRLPICAGHRIISLRCCVVMTVSVNEFNETYFAKNCSSTAPRTKTPWPSKAASSNTSVISRPRAKVIGPGISTRRMIG